MSCVRTKLHPHGILTENSALKVFTADVMLLNPSAMICDGA